MAHTHSEQHINEYLERLNSDGYFVVRQFFPPSLREELESTIVSLYHLQCLKLLEVRDRATKGPHPQKYTSLSDLDSIIAQMEDIDKEVLYQVQQLIASSPIAHKFASYEPLVQLAGALLSCPSSLLATHVPGFFVNSPGSKRLLYKWHSEGHYYPKRRRFLNLWFPLFRSKTADNGTMYVAIGSHKKHYQDFVEYKGYDKATFKNANSFIQFEIPESELREFKKVPMITDPGDLVVFDRDLVHTSSSNTSQSITYTGVMRFFDYRSDLTLTGTAGAWPYGQDYGRPGLDSLPIVS